MKRIQSSILSSIIVLAVAILMPAQAFAESSGGTQGDICKLAYIYTDTTGSWCENSVLEYGYDDIFSDGSELFHPDRSITRMEFARLLHRALGIEVNYLVEPEISDYFSDVPDSDDGAGALYDLVSCGIIDKTGTFDPSGTLARDEMVHYLVNAFGHFLNGVYNMPGITMDRFGDTSLSDTVYSSDVDTAAALGLVNGKDGILFCPREAATRAEAVTAVGRLAQLVSNFQKAEVDVKTCACEKDGGLRLTLEIINNTDKAVTITSNSLQKYDFAFFDASGKELYRWSSGQMFGMVVTSTVIDPGDEELYTETIDAGTYSSIKDGISDIRGYIIGTTNDFEIASDGYSIPVPEIKD